MTSNPGRIAWIDAAKGFSILMVVAFHGARNFNTTGYDVSDFVSFNEFFKIIRMPTFFMVSGMLATSILRSSLRDIIGKKTVLYFYIFFVWTLIYWAIYEFMPHPMLREKHDFIWFIKTIIRPDTGAWFVWVLAVFFTVTKISMDFIKPKLLLVMAAFVSVVGFAEPPLPFAYVNVMKYFFFFVAGCYGKSVIIGVVAARTKALATGIILFSVAAWALQMSSNKLLNAPIYFFGAIGGVLVLCIVLDILSGTWLANSLCALGRNTLGVYLMHEIFLVAIMYSLIAFSADVVSQSPYIITCLVIIASILISILAKATLTRLGLDVLFRAPKLLAPRAV